MSSVGVITVQLSPSIKYCWSPDSKDFPQVNVGRLTNIIPFSILINANPNEILRSSYLSYSNLAIKLRLHFILQPAQDCFSVLLGIDLSNQLLVILSQGRMCAARLSAYWRKGSRNEKLTAYTHKAETLRRMKNTNHQNPILSRGRLMRCAKDPLIRKRNEILRSRSFQTKRYIQVSQLIP